MGTKMPKAYYAQEEKILNINDANIKMNGSLFCEVAICRVPVTFVDAHKKKLADKTVVVNPYFRLTSNEKKHYVECRYNTIGQIKVIAQDSDDNIIKAIEDNRYSFRLNVIDEALKDLINLNKEQTKNDGQCAGANKPSKTYINQGKLDSYLSTMQKIMRLRSLAESNEELRELLVLQYGKQEVKWNKFYYESDDLQKCYTYIKRNEVTHPMCIDGVIKEFSDPTEKFKFSVLKLTSPWVEPDKNGVINRPVVELIIRSDKVLDYIQSDIKQTKVAVYSKFQVSESKVLTFQDGDETKKIRYLNIKGNLYHRNQIILY
ncbi:hypothetical protein [Paenibacillus sp. RC21]|uniref:hypothetical protein n=1 Tax=Paenibacillus sp. RC21 TaxID=3156312 RepID=UPI0038378760